MKFTIRTAWSRGPVTVFLAKVANESGVLKEFEAQHTKEILAIFQGLEKAFAYLSKQAQRNDEILVGIAHTAIFTAFKERKFYWTKAQNLRKDRSSAFNSPFWEAIRRHFMNGLLVQAEFQKYPDLRQRARTIAQRHKQKALTKENYRDFLASQIQQQQYKKEPFSK